MGTVVFKDLQYQNEPLLFGYAEIMFRKWCWRSVHLSAEVNLVCAHLFLQFTFIYREDSGDAIFLDLNKFFSIKWHRCTWHARYDRKWPTNLDKLSLLAKRFSENCSA